MKYGPLFCAASVLVACTGGEHAIIERAALAHKGESGDAGTAAPPPDDTASPPDLGDEAVMESAGDEAAGPLDNVDILLMVDDSGSMAQEQVRLTAQLNRLVGSLIAGNRAYPSAPRGDADRFVPAKSIHVGVITSNLGSPPGVAQLPSQLCPADNGASLGGNAALHTSGFTASTPLVDANTLTLVAPGNPACADVSLHKGYLAFGRGAGEVDPENEAATTKAIADFSCLASVGIGGCGIEQPLEAIWKALSPESDNSFVGPDTHGQGTRANAGFLRPDSILVVLSLTDEDDCSVTAQGTTMFERNGEPYVGVRCQVLQQSAPAVIGREVQPVSRYAKGLLSLRTGHPERVIYAAIAGFPEVDADYTDPAALLDHPQMATALDPNSNDKELVSACGSDVGDGKAYPGRRYAQLAGEIEAGGGSFVLGSICSDTYDAVRDQLVRKVSSLLTDAAEE
jgi:hypothetical protein